MTSDIMKGKKGLILGVANEKSIAYGIAQAVIDAGGSVAMTYIADQYKDKMQNLSDKLGVESILKLNVVDEDSIDASVDKIQSEWGKLDFLVHAVAFSDKKELSGRYVDTSKDNFLNSMHISCYSFTNLAKKFLPLLSAAKGTLLTISYYGAKKVVQNYNVMGVCKAALEASVLYLANDLGRDGIRVNAISAGPIRTLASSAISDFHGVLNTSKSFAPLGRNVSIGEVGKSAVFLLSDLSSGITGEIMYVDGGYNTVGLKNTKNNETDGE